MWVRRRRWKSACSLLTLCRSEAEAYLHTSYAVSLLQFPPSTRRLAAYGMQAWHGEGEGRISFCHPAANLSSLHHSSPFLSSIVFIQVLGYTRKSAALIPSFISPSVFAASSRACQCHAFGYLVCLSCAPVVHTCTRDLANALSIIQSFFRSSE